MSDCIYKHENMNLHSINTKTCKSDRFLKTMVSNKDHQCFETSKVHFIEQISTLPRYRQENS